MPIGVVEGIVGIRRFRLTFVGQPDHAGTTPMDRRKDAFFTAAQYATKSRELVVRDGGGRAVTTIGVVDVRPVHEADDGGVDLLVVGGPTHMHGMTSSLSRRMAVKAGEEDGVEIGPGAREEVGLRQWLSKRSGEHREAAAFDTRGDASPRLTGMASRGIHRRLYGAGFRLHERWCYERGDGGAWSKRMLYP